MAVLKYILSLAAVIVTAANVSFGQKYSLVPGDTIQIKGMMEDTQTLTIYQRNISGDTLQLKWKKISESVPEKWEASVCDNLICYSTLIEDGVMNPVPPNETGYLLLHFTAHVNFGTAIVRYSVWDVSSPDRIDTLTFITTVQDPLGVSENMLENTFTVSPNPAVNHLDISLNTSAANVYTIIDVYGKEMCSFESIKDSRVDISQLPAGIYFLQIQSMKKRFIHKFIKQ